LAGRDVSSIFSFDPLRAHPSSQFSLVAFAALAIGLADAALVFSGKLGAGGAFQAIPPRLWVIAPICWAVVAIALAIPIFALSRRHGAACTAIAMGFLFLGIRIATQPPLRMAIGALAAVTAAALVWQLAKRWTSAPRRTAAVLTAVTLAALVVAAATMSRHRGVALRSGSDAARHPDVVVVFLDTVPYDSIFLRPGIVDPRFPALARLAAQSTVYDRAYTPSPWTLPAHLSAVTGLGAGRTGVGFDDQRYDLATPTLAERFRRRGYATAAVLSNSFLNAESGFARGFESFEQAQNALDVCRTAPGTLLDRWSPWFAGSVCNWTASAVTRRATRQVQNAGDRPLFLLLNYMDAHDPYYVESRCSEFAQGAPIPRDVPPDQYRSRYHGSHIAAIRCIDKHLAGLFSVLDARKRETVTAVLSDHGEHFGEHGLVRHGNSLYRQLLHVPLMVRVPGQAPRRVSEPVSIAALPGLVGAMSPEPFSGAVVSLLIPPAATASAVQWSAIGGRWHFITQGNQESLFDVIADPAEERNLLGLPSSSPARESLAHEVAREKRLLLPIDVREFRSLGYVR
jgi:arylsulfatase A-like enzyme